MLLYEKQNIWPINSYLISLNRVFRRKVVKMACGCQKGTPLVWITPHKVFKIGSYLYFNCTSMNQRDDLYMIIDTLIFFFSLTNGIWLLFIWTKTRFVVCCHIDSFLLSKVYAVWHAKSQKHWLSPWSCIMCWKKHREKCQKHTSYNNL